MKNEFDHSIGKNTQFGRGQDPTLGGRRKKAYGAFLDRHKDKENPTKDQFYEVVGKLMILTSDEFDDERNQEDNPQWLRWLMSDLSNKKIRSRLMQDYRDWMFGRAKQQHDHTSNDQPLKIILNIDDKYLESDEFK